MTLKNKNELLAKMTEIVSEYLDTRDFGEYGVTVIIDHGRVVKINRVDREKVVHYERERLVIEK